MSAADNRAPLGLCLVTGAAGFGGSNYQETKIEAEKRVLAANQPGGAGDGGLYTCALRADGIYFTRRGGEPRCAARVTRHVVGVKIPFSCVRVSSGPQT